MNIVTQTAIFLIIVTLLILTFGLFIKTRNHPQDKAQNASPLSDICSPLSP
jgi:ABC-type antimicrobial peptide transport system permease subunit